MNTTSAAILQLAGLISTGDLALSREWAHDHKDSLGELRSNAAAQAIVAHACNQWGAPMVWPWSDTQKPLAAHMRVLVAIRAGRSWIASEDTIATIVAARWASFDGTGWIAA